MKRHASMNCAYRLVWSDRLNAFVVASEITRGRGKSSSVVRKLAAIGALLSLPAGAMAQDLAPGTLPTGAQVTYGQATINQSGAQMQVIQGGSRLITNWQTFNIGSGAAVQFVQPDASAIALNRVMAGGPSQLNGSLSANGKVFLINPSGVIFGAGAAVNVGGLVASTLDLSDSDFLAGKYAFANGGAAAGIVNNGALQAADGGYIALIAPRVQNNGSIVANQGTAALAAGDQVSLNFTGDRLINFTVDKSAVDALAENHQLIQADGGTVILSARAANALVNNVVNNDGVIEARSMSTRNGRIELDGGDSGVVSVSGKLDATGGAGSTGGAIQVTGDKIGVGLNGAAAVLDASGASGGGSVLVGGSYQGLDPSVRRATSTYIGRNTVLAANATDAGNGGTVVAWSDVDNADSATRAYGAFYARGGVNAGDGGRIETSGHWLDVSGAQGDASAPRGKGGSWLFDPYDVTITSATANGGFSSSNGTDTWTPSASGSTILNTDIQNRLNNGTSVTVTTGNSGGENGDITVDASITKSSGADASLTLQAANSIIVNQAISNTSSAGKLNVQLNADNDNGGHDGVGIVMLNNSISTGGGGLTFGDGSTMAINGVTSKVGGDVYVGGNSAVSLTTNGGNVAVNGEMIIANPNGLSISTANGNVAFGGLLNSGNTYAAVNKTLDWQGALTDAASGSGAGVGDTYLATITSRLENAVASRTVNYQPSWLGGRRVTGIGTDNTWRWVTGPEGLQDNGHGQAFFTQNGSSTSNGSGGTPINGMYTNWNGGEPNNSGGANLTQEAESGLQFVGSSGLWNDLPKSGTTLNYYVKETNLAASPLTVNAGAGTVTFSGAVGDNKALASLNVTAGGINVNGGVIKTQGAQTYNGNLSLGAANTVISQSDAGTDFTLPANVSISYAGASRGSLTIDSAKNIILNSGDSILSSNGALDVTLSSRATDTANVSSTNPTANGNVELLGTTITTNGGNLTIGGGDAAGSGYASGTSANTVPTNAGIYLRDVNLTTNGGNIAMRGVGAAGDGTNTYQTADGIGLWSVNGSVAMNAGAGTINLTGYARVQGKQSNNPNGQCPTCGVDYTTSEGVLFQSNGANSQGITLTSSANTASAISITGNAAQAGGTNVVQSAWGIFFAAQNTSAIDIKGAGNAGVSLSGTAGHGSESSSGGGASGIAANGGTGLKIESAAGSITLSGTAGTTNYATAVPAGIQLRSAEGSPVISSTSGSISLLADKMDVSGASISSTGSLTLAPLTSGTTIGLTNNGTGGTLQLPIGWFSGNSVLKDGFSQIVVGNANAGAITTSGTLSFTDNLKLISGDNITLNAATSASNNTLSLQVGNGKTAKANAGQSVLGLELLGNGGSFDFSNAGNYIGALAGNVGSLTLKDNEALTIGATGNSAGLSAATGITVQTLGNTSDLSLNNAVTSTSGNIVLASSRNFTNTVANGGGINAGTGQYFVYSADPSSSTEGMTGYLKHYNQTYTAGATPSYATSGNWFLYSVAPTLSVTPGAQSMTYGSALPTFTASYSGFIDGDTAATSGMTGTASFTVGGSKSSSNNYVAGSHNVAYSSGLASSLGYQFADNAASSNELTVNQLALNQAFTVANRTYDGTTSASISSYGALAGKISGDNVSLNAGSAGAAFDTSSAGNGKTARLTVATLGGTDAANYTVSGQTTANITPKTLNLANLQIANKTYDGSTAATVAAYGSLAGVVGADAVSLNSANATAKFSDAAAGLNKAVTVHGLGLSGADAGDYAIGDQSAKANITIDQGRSASISSATNSVTGLLGGSKDVGGGKNADSANSSKDLINISGAGNSTPQAAGAGGSDTNTNTVSGSLGNQGNGKPVGNAGGDRNSASNGGNNATQTTGGDVNSTPQAAGAGGSDTNTNTVSGSLGNQGNGKPVGNAGGDRDTSSGNTGSGGQTSGGNGNSTPQAAGAGGSDSNTNTVSGNLGNQGNDKPVGNAGGSRTGSSTGGNGRSNSTPQAAGAGGSDTNSNTVSGTLGTQGNGKPVGNAGGDRNGQTAPGNGGGANSDASSGRTNSTTQAAGAGGSDTNSNTTSGSLGNQGNGKPVGNAGGDRSDASNGDPTGQGAAPEGGNSTPQASGAGGSDTNTNTVSGTLGNQGNDKPVGNAGGDRNSTPNGDNNATQTTGGDANSTQQAAGAGGSDTNTNTVSGTLGNQGNGKPVGNAGGDKSSGTTGPGGPSASGSGNSTPQAAGAGGSDTNTNTVSGTLGNQGNGKPVGNAGGDRNGAFTGNTGGSDSGANSTPQAAGAGGSDTNTNTVSGTLGNQGNGKPVGNAGGDRNPSSAGNNNAVQTASGNVNSTSQAAGAGNSDTNTNTVSGTLGNQGNGKAVGNAGGDRNAPATNGRSANQGGTSAGGGNSTPQAAGAGGSDTNTNTVSGTLGNQGNGKLAGNAGGDRSGSLTDGTGGATAGNGNAGGGTTPPAAGAGGSDTNTNTTSGSLGNLGNDKPVGNAGDDQIHTRGNDNSSGNGNADNGGSSNTNAGSGSNGRNTGNGSTSGGTSGGNTSGGNIAGGNSGNGGTDGGRSNSGSTNNGSTNSGSTNSGSTNGKDSTTGITNGGSKNTPTSGNQNGEGTTLIFRPTPGFDDAAASSGHQASMPVPKSGEIVQNSVALIVVRPGMPPVAQKGFAVKQSNKELALRPIDNVDQDFTLPGAAQRSTSLTVAGANGVKYNFTVQRTDKGVVIRPLSNASKVFAEGNTDKLVGQSLLKAQEHLSVTVDKIKSVYLIM